MPNRTTYFNDQETAWIKSQPKGYLRRLVQAVIRQHIVIVNDKFASVEKLNESKQLHEGPTRPQEVKDEH